MMKIWIVAFLIIPSIIDTFPLKNQRLKSFSDSRQYLHDRNELPEKSFLSILKPVAACLVIVSCIVPYSVLASSMFTGFTTPELDSFYRSTVTATTGPKTPSDVVR